MRAPWGAISWASSCPVAQQCAQANEPAQPAWRYKPSPPTLLPPLRYPAIIYQLQLFYPPCRLGVAFTYVTTATAAAGLLGAPLAAALLSLDGLAGLAGWRWLFVIEGLPTLVLAAALPFLLPASPLAAGFLSPAEQRWLWAQRHGSAGLELVASPTAAAAAAAAGEDTSGQAAAPAGPFSGSDAERGTAAGAGSGEQRPLLPPPQPPSPVSLGGPQAEPQWEQDGSAAGSTGLTKTAFREGLLDGRIWHLAASMLLIDAVMNAACVAGGMGGLNCIWQKKQITLRSRSPALRICSVYRSRSPLCSNFWVPSLVRAILEGQLGAAATSSGPKGGGSGGQASAALNVKAALLSALPFCAAAVAMVLNARHARRTDERRLHTALPMLCTAVALGLLPLATNPAPALAGLTAAAAGTWAVHGPFFSWPAALLEPRAAALGFALVKTGGERGSVLVRQPDGLRLPGPQSHSTRAGSMMYAYRTPCRCAGRLCWAAPGGRPGRRLARLLGGHAAAGGRGRCLQCAGSR